MYTKAKAHIAKRAEKYLLPAAGEESPRVISKAMPLGKGNIQGLFVEPVRIRVRKYLRVHS